MRTIVFCPQLHDAESCLSQMWLRRQRAHAMSTRMTHDTESSLTPRSGRPSGGSLENAWHAIRRSQCGAKRAPHQRSQGLDVKCPSSDWTSCEHSSLKQPGSHQRSGTKREERDHELQPLAKGEVLRVTVDTGPQHPRLPCLSRNPRQTQPRHQNSSEENNQSQAYRGAVRALASDHSSRRPTTLSVEEPIRNARKLP